MLMDAPERIWACWHDDREEKYWAGPNEVYRTNDCVGAYAHADLLTAAEAERDAALARVERLRGAAEYILDGMGIDGPDYTIPPDDDLLDASNGPWVRDTLTRLAAALAEDAKP